MRYGEAPRDDSDQDEDEQQLTLNKTPTTQRRIRKETSQQKSKELGPWATACTLFKGFVCTGILYLPLNFSIGGWGFLSIAISIAACVTLLCSKLLLEVNEKLGGSFSEIGMRTFGKTGKTMVDIALIGS